MASLTGEQLKDTYESLLKLSDNDALTATYKEVTDGEGAGTNLYVGTGGNVGIGTSSPTNYTNFTTLAIGDSVQGGVLELQYNGAQAARIAAVNPNTITLSTNNTERLRAYSGGDISLRDTSNNEAFYWDASTARLGLGTDSPGTDLEVNGDGLTFRLDGTANTARGILLRNVGTATGEIKTDGNLDINIEDAGRTMRFLNGNTPRLVIDSSGNVGIGTASPIADSLTLYKATYPYYYAQNSSSGTNASDGFRWGLESNTEARIDVLENLPMTFRTNAQERMRIDSDGNVGIGGSPSTFANYTNVSIKGGSSGSNLDFLNSSGTRVGAIVSNPSTDLIIETNEATPLVFKTNDNPAMTIDSSGRVGIGETNPDRELDLKNSADNCIMSITSSTSHLSGLVLGDTADDDRGGILYNNTSDYLYFLSNAQERLRIDSSGNVGIGCSPSDRLEVKGATAKGALVLSSGDTTIIGNDVIGQINFKDYDADAHAGGDQNDLVNIKAIALHESGGATALDGSTGEGYALSFSTSKRPSPNALFTVSEAMRIDSSGNILMGTEGVTDGTTYFGSTFRADSNSRRGLKMATSVTTAQDLVEFFNPAGRAGYIQINSSTTSYVTSSDYRLKENVVEMTGALDRVDQLKPSRFNFIADADTTVDGFLAHEVADVVPEAITGEKDATEEYEVTPAVLDDDGNVIEEAVMGTRPVYQGIDQSKLVPLLVGAIQELRAEIEQLKNQ